MRARIRALSAVLAILGLVAPTGAVAQAPPTAEIAAAQARTAVPPGGNLPLSLDEAVARALENNVDIAVERYNPELSAQDVISAEGYYDPFLFANLSKTSTDTKGTNFFSGGDVVNTKTGLWNFGLGIPLKTGGEFSLAFNNNKRDTTNAFTTFNPIYNSNLSISLTQPLLKGFKVDAPRNQLRLAKKSREISDVQFRQTIINTVATVKGYYYELLFAIDNLVAAQTNLELAKRLLGENEIRVKVGTMAPLDVVTAQSEVAAREDGRDPGRERAGRGRGRPEARHLPAERPRDVEHPGRPHRSPHRRAHAGEHRGRGPERAPEPHRRRGRPQEPRAGRLQPPVRPEPAAAAARPRGHLRRLRRRRDAAHPRRGRRARSRHRSPAATATPSTRCSAGTTPPGRSGSTSPTRSRTAPRRRTPRPPSSARTRRSRPSGGSSCRSRPRCGPPAAGSSPASSAWRRPRPPGGSPPSASTPRRRSSPPACPRTSSSPRPSATWPSSRSTSCARSPTTARASSTTSACRRPASPAAVVIAVLSGGSSGQAGQALAAGAASASTQSSSFGF